MSVEDRTVMWEAVAVAGRVDELVAHAREHADPRAQLYRSADDRVVLIDPSGTGLDDVPAGLLARDAHVWHFQQVER